ncbi:MAG: hypothetical protein EXS12_04715 [Phycisphaerales bacterium]|nr:hypothetical protein [Phycisphaerales bacterium]
MLIGSCAFTGTLAGSMLQQPSTQIPAVNNQSFQSKPAGHTAIHQPTLNQPAISTANAGVTVTTPSMSPVLKCLVQARDKKKSLADREEALFNAQKEIAALPPEQQWGYVQLINATRQRLVVDAFLFNSGQVQNNISTKTK